MTDPERAQCAMVAICRRFLQFALSDGEMKDVDLWTRQSHGWSQALNTALAEEKAAEEASDEP